MCNSGSKPGSRTFQLSLRRLDRCRSQVAIRLDHEPSGDVNQPYQQTRNPVKPDFATTGAQGRLLVTMLAAIAEFERELIRERTGAGRERAMAEGVKFGRKRKLSEYQRAEAIKRRAAGETLAAIAKSYGVDISMISRL
jgi:Resolvase, N terminal domain